MATSWSACFNITNGVTTFGPIVFCWFINITTKLIRLHVWVTWSMYFQTPVRFSGVAIVQLFFRVLCSGITRFRRHCISVKQAPSWAARVSRRLFHSLLAQPCRNGCARVGDLWEPVRMPTCHLGWQRVATYIDFNEIQLSPIYV